MLCQPWPTPSSRSRRGTAPSALAPAVGATERVEPDERVTTLCRSGGNPTPRVEAVLQRKGKGGARRSLNQRFAIPPRGIGWLGDGQASEVHSISRRRRTRLHRSQCGTLIAESQRRGGNRPLERLSGSSRLRNTQDPPCTLRQRAIRPPSPSAHQLTARIRYLSDHDPHDH